MATIDVFNMKREKVGSLDLADSVFASEVKEQLFYEVVKAQLASRRQGTAAAKERSGLALRALVAHHAPALAAARRAARRAASALLGARMTPAAESAAS